MGPPVCFSKQDEVIVLKIALELAQSPLPHPLGTFTQDFGILAWVSLAGPHLGRACVCPASFMPAF